MLIVVAGFSMHKQTNVSTKLPWKWNVPAQQMLSPFCKRGPESQRRREAQACHATTAVIHQFYEKEDTKNYLKDLDNMHKIVLCVKNEEDMKSLHVKLTEAEIDHKLWIEQPENFPTCLAVRPYVKDEVQKHFKKLKLFRE